VVIIISGVLGIILVPHTLFVECVGADPVREERLETDLRLPEESGSSCKEGQSGWQEASRLTLARSGNVVDVESS
jgi:hypothetical protein